MSENDYSKTPNPFLSALCFLRDEITKAYRGGDNDFLSRTEIIDALEFVLEPVRAHDTAKRILESGTLDEFVNIGNEFENAFSRWVKMALIPDYQIQLDEIRADMIPYEGFDFLCMYRPDDYRFLPFAFDPNPTPINGEVLQFTKAGGYDNLWKLIYIGKTMARAAQARKGAERIETKGNVPSRKKSKLTRKEVAKIFGVSESTVKNWETGKHKPPTLMSGEHYSEEMRENRGWLYRFVADYSRQLREEHKSVPNNKYCRLDAAIENKIARDKVWGGGDCKSNRRPNEYE